MLRRHLILGGAAPGRAARPPRPRGPAPLRAARMVPGPDPCGRRLRQPLHRRGAPPRGRPDRPLDGRRLSLFEDFFYADGERDQKTLIFERLGEGRYRGTHARGRRHPRPTSPRPPPTASSSLRRRPQAALRRHAPVLPGHADAQARRHVLNVATVYRFFIPVGDVTLVFRRGRLPAHLKRSGGARPRPDRTSSVFREAARRAIRRA